MSNYPAFNLLGLFSPFIFFVLTYASYEQPQSMSIGSGNCSIGIVSGNLVQVVARQLPGLTPPPPPVAGQGAWDSYVYGVFLISCGLVMLFNGYKNRYIFCGLNSFLGFASIVMVLMYNFEPHKGYPQRKILYMAIPLGVGLVIAVILTWKSTIGIPISAGYGGFVIALWFSALGQSDGLLKNYAPGRALMMVFGYTLFTIVAYVDLRFPAILSTSVTGAYAIVLGVDMFTKAGFAEGLPYFLYFGDEPKNPPLQEYQTNRTVYIMLAAIVAGIIIGCVVQYKRFKHKVLTSDSIGFEKLF